MANGFFDLAPGITLLLTHVFALKAKHALEMLGLVWILKVGTRLFLVMGTI